MGEEIGGEAMKYYELIVTAKLTEEKNNNEIYEVIYNTINQAMLQDEVLKEFHEKNEFKYYSFSSLQPLAKDKVYKKDMIYFFNIRSIDSTFLLRLKRVLPRTETLLQVVCADLRPYSQKFISTISTLSPVLLTMENKHYWTQKDGLNEFITRFSKNIVRKYNAYYQTQIPETTIFITGVEQTNEKPIRIPYKTTTLIGNKFNIFVKEDELSQNLAFFGKAVGIRRKKQYWSRLL